MQRSAPGNNRRSPSHPRWPSDPPSEPDVPRGVQLLGRPARVAAVKSVLRLQTSAYEQLLVSGSAGAVLSKLPERLTPGMPVVVSTQVLQRNLGRAPRTLKAPNAEIICENCDGTCVNVAAALATRSPACVAATGRATNVDALAGTPCSTRPATLI